MSKPSPSPGDHDPRAQDAEAKRARAQSMQDAGRYAGLGLSLAVSLCLFTWGGYLLDQRLGTLPLFLLLGVFVGGGLGTYSLIVKVSGGTSDRSKDPKV